MTAGGPGRDEGQAQGRAGAVGDAERAVQRVAVGGGVQLDHADVTDAAPLDEGMHDLAAEALAPMAGLGADVLHVGADAGGVARRRQSVGDGDRGAGHQAADPVGVIHHEGGH